MANEVTDAMKEAGAAVLRAAGVDAAHDLAHEVLVQALAARPLPEGMVPFKPMTTPESRDALAKWMSLNAHDGSAYEGLMHLMVDRDLYETEVCRLSAELDRLRARLAEAEAEKGAAVAAERELLAAGASAANILYNMAQSPSVKDDVRKSMKAAQERWDAVRAAIRARGGDNG